MKTRGGESSRTLRKAVFLIQTKKHSFLGGCHSVDIDLSNPADANQLKSGALWSLWLHPSVSGD